MALAAIEIRPSSQADGMVPVDPPIGDIWAMADYVPSDSSYPKDFRILDCWQCFEAQGKVCMD